MTTTDVQDVTLIPVPACPAWCEEPEGHPWVESDIDGRLMRGHFAGIAEARIVSFQEAGDTDPEFGFYVDLEHGTPEDARRIGVELLRLADLAEGTSAG